MKDMKLRISPLSDRQILDISYGEVVKDETMSFRTRVPTPVEGGLHCEKIFGPINNYRCSCGHLSNMSHAYEVCSRCGVECTTRDVRNERFGHIELGVPIVFPMTMKLIQSLLNIRQIDMKNLISYKTSICIVKDDLGGLVDKDGDLACALVYNGEIKDKENEQYIKTWMDRGIIGLERVLNQIDTEKTLELQAAMGNPSAESYKNSESFRFTDMISHKILVFPAGHRHVKASLGRYTSGPLNELYRKVVRRSLRCKTILEEFMDKEDYHAIIALESMMMQKAIMDLMVNETTYHNVKLKPIMDSIDGKYGTIRGSALGKRVDYSGRSVITSGPNIPLDHIGIPLPMVYELMKPEIIGELMRNGHSHHDLGFKEAENIYLRKDEKAIKLMEKKLKNQVILLNRAPSLHRYSVMAFKVKIVPGKALLLNPLIMAPFNADCDGDQMAVHNCLSHQSRNEAWELCSPRSNLRSSRNGSPLMSPSHEQIVGIHYLSRIEGDKPVKIENNFRRLKNMVERGYLGVRDRIIYINHDRERIETSVGRMMLGEILGAPVTEELDKGKITSLISTMISEYNQDVALRRIDRLGTIGFKYSTKMALSMGMDDFRTPENKTKIFEAATVFEKNVREDIASGSVDKRSGKEKIMRRWDSAIQEVEKEFMDNTDDENPIMIMYHTKSRVSPTQIKQMVVAKGILADISNNISETPLQASLCEGLGTHEYFLSCKGTRKSFGDNHMIVPKSGYLTRKLVNSLREDCIVSDGKNLDTKGIPIKMKYAVGRVTIDGTVIPPNKSDEIVQIFSPITYDCIDGPPVNCFGTSLSTGQMTLPGTNMGIVSAHSVSEPSTQLSLQSKHTSGSARFSGADKVVVAVDKGVVSILPSEEGYNRIELNGKIYIGHESLSEFYVEDGEEVEKGDILIAYVNDVTNSDIAGTLPKVEFLLGSGGISGPVAINSRDEGELSIRHLASNEFEVYVGDFPQGKVSNVPLSLPIGSHVKVGDKLTYGIESGFLFFKKTSMLVESYLIFRRQLGKLFSDSGITIADIHFEVIWRCMTEQVISNGKRTLRRIDPEGKIDIRGIGASANVYPSWLQSICMGRVKKRLSDALAMNEVSLDTNVEKLMSGRLISSPYVYNK